MPSDRTHAQCTHNETANQYIQQPNKYQHFDSARVKDDDNDVKAAEKIDT